MVMLKNCLDFILVCGVRLLEVGIDLKIEPFGERVHPELRILFFAPFIESLHPACKLTEGHGRCGERQRLAPSFNNFDISVCILFIA